MNSILVGSKQSKAACQHAGSMCSLHYKVDPGSYFLGNYEVKVKVEFCVCLGTPYLKLCTWVVKVVH